jgi:MFS transporter, PPP family, 3-phenylpropionic acid transporter
MTSAMRFKLSYLLFFAAIAILFNYYALYLQRAGLSGTQVGLILAVLPLARMLSQPIWGLLGDIYRLRRVILSAACFGSALAALALERSESFAWLLAVTIPLAILNGPIGPFCDALALEYIERTSRQQEYGRLRLWGSVGFAVASLAVGALVIGESVRLIVYLYSITMALMGLVTATLPDAPGGERATWRGSGSILRGNPILIRFLIGTTLIGMTLGVVNSYLIIYLTDIGAAGWMSGLTFALAGVLEVPLMAYASMLISRWGLRAVLIGGVALQPLRWVLYTVITIPLLVVPTQLFHSIAMLSLLVAGVLFTDQLLAGPWRATGQTIYSAALHGIGPSIGVFGAGVIYEYAGIGMVWWACVIANLIGVSVMAWAVWSPAVVIAPGTRSKHLQ